MADSSNGPTENDAFLGSRPQEKVKLKVMFASALVCFAGFLQKLLSVLKSTQCVSADQWLSL